VGPSHGVQSLRHRLLPRWSPTGSRVLPANLLQRGLLSPRGHRSCREPAPARASHGVTASFSHSPAPGMPKAETHLQPVEDPLLWCGVLPGCRWVSAPPLPSPGA
ncbi:unnamed protein product, partial [Bubo scandiacus]